MIRLTRFAPFAVLLLVTTAFAQQADPPVLKGQAAFGDWHADRPGVRRLIRPQDLQAPDVTESVSNGAGLAQMPKGAKPQLPPGFSAEMIASGIAKTARRPCCPERRPVRRRQRSQPDTRLSSCRGQRETRRESDLRQTPHPALRHRVLSAGRQAAMGLCRQQQQRGALCLSRAAI